MKLSALVLLVALCYVNTENSEKAKTPEKAEKPEKDEGESFLRKCHFY